MPRDSILSVIGVDLGQTVDYTAIVIDEIAEDRADSTGLIHGVRFAERLPLGTPYPEVATTVAKMADSISGSCVIAVDATGVGAPVVDLLADACTAGAVHPVTITSGNSPRCERVPPWQVHYWVPKRDLVSNMNVALQTGRLKIAGALRHRHILIAELQSFRVNINTSGHDTYGAWRERDHDDLVLALAIAVWVGEEQAKTLFAEIVVGPVLNP